MLHSSMAGFAAGFMHFKHKYVVGLGRFYGRCYFVQLGVLPWFYKLLHIYMAGFAAGFIYFKNQYVAGLGCC